MATALILPRVTTNNADGKLTTTQLPFQSPPQGKDHNDCKGGAQYKFISSPGGILKYILIMSGYKERSIFAPIQDKCCQFFLLPNAHPGGQQMILVTPTP